MVNVITIEREYGCGAGTIAKQIAAKLGWTLWDREITSEIARRLKCDVRSVEQREERPDPAFYRLVKAFMRGSYEDSYTGGSLELLDAEQLARLFEKVIQNIASRGNCVIVGRGSPYFLREREDALRVFLYAGYEEKMRRLTALGTSEEEAEELLERVDRERATFVKRYYGQIWPKRELYHLMINTGVGDDGVLEAIQFEMDLLNKKNLVLRM
ncbi:MAG TPA: cytidylate kinase-like family protein [Bryobacteraceae bacterium]|jgi:cytidylate kinase|nr:cytidylate kinase-like family protein [Bryobacteraceae bacterium]